MGSRFLNGSGGDGTDLSELTTGGFDGFLSSLRLQNLTPSLPVKTDSSRELTAGLIEASDCNFVPVVSITSAGGMVSIPSAVTGGPRC